MEKGIRIIPSLGDNVLKIEKIVDPTTSDFAYPIGILWINTDTNKIFFHYGSGVWEQIVSSETEISETNVDTGTTVVDSFSDTVSKGAEWSYVLDKGPGTNMRKGTISAVWNPTSGSTPIYRETSTNDLGDTSGVSFSVDKSGHTVQLKCTVTSDDWAVYIIRTLIG